MFSDDEEQPDFDEIFESTDAGDGDNTSQQREDGNSIISIWMTKSAALRAAIALSVTVAIVMILVFVVVPANKNESNDNQSFSTTKSKQGFDPESPHVVSDGLPTPPSLSSDVPSLVPSGLPSDLPSSSPSDTPSLIPSVFPSFLLPTTQTSSIAPMAPTQAPTPFPECSANERLFELWLSLDNFPDETSWELQNANTNQVIQSRAKEFYQKSGEQPLFNMCVPRFARLIFIIRDAFGDGMCCVSGNGSYRVSMDDETVCSGGSFGQSAICSIDGRTADPTESPTRGPTAPPTSAPSHVPTLNPTPQPTPGPSNSPTPRPTPGPTKGPTPGPTPAPIPSPSSPPTSEPTASPSQRPSLHPSRQPTHTPSMAPTQSPVTFPPTSKPTAAPSHRPTLHPTLQPTYTPSMAPTQLPVTSPPTSEPTATPSHRPTLNPTPQPTYTPSMVPTQSPVQITTSFLAIADVPYNPLQERELTIQMDDVATAHRAKPASTVDFMIHLGDIRSAREGNNCRQSDYTNVANILSKSPVPVFIVVGDNEWSDCPNRRQGWNFWLDNLQGLEGRYWNHSFAIERMADRPETFAFVHNGALFLGLNLVGGSAFNNAEWTDRLSGQATWAISLMRRHGLPTVLLGHADPTNGNHEDFFNPMQTFLRDEWQNSIPVLYLCGDKHEWRYEPNFYQQSNWLRVMLTGGSSEPPLKVTVDASESLAARTFQYDRQL